MRAGDGNIYIKMQVVIYITNIS